MSSHQHHRHSSAFSTAADFRSTSSRSPSPSPSTGPSPVSPILSPGDEGLSRRHSWNRDRSGTVPMGSETHLHPLASASMASTAASGGGPRSPISRQGYDELDLGLPVVHPHSPYARQHQSYYSSETSLHSEGINSSESDLDLPSRGGKRKDADQEFLSPGPSSLPYSSPHRRPYDPANGQAMASGPSKLASSVGRSSTLRSVSRTLRNASVRVVNIMGKERDEGLARLPDDDGSYSDSVEDLKKDEGVEMVQTPGERARPEPMPPESGALRGRTLGIFGPRSPIRRTMNSMMRSP